ncbi:hypothetical protein FHR38_001432 [Micromonospora polyrhachis]|uniref:Uncharacterized protein n=1 Tax=Micromonospora polyrhachis TaxID=1282883 RepID=A0A7W7SMV6_9ACTN|nr:hypothetical protein [Micromonospora polyrhachis]
MSVIRWVLFVCCINRRKCIYLDKCHGVRGVAQSTLLLVNR